MKRALALLFTAGVLAAGAGTASATYPVGGCPTGDGWSLVTVGEVIPAIDNGNFKDQNGDGYVCQRDNAGQTKKNNNFETWTVKDNTNPL